MPTAKNTGQYGKAAVAKPRRRKPRVRARRPSAVGYSDKIAARRRGRLIAFVLDKLLFHTVVALIGTVFAGIGAPIFSFLYFSSHDSVLGSGRSLGRAVVGQRLMSTDGEEIGHVRASLRNGLRWLLWLTMLPLLVDIGLVLFGDGRLIADYVFGTRVYEDPLRVRQRLLKEGRDQRSLERVDADLWAGDIEDEHMDEARREIDEIERVSTEARAELDDFERRLSTGEGLGSEPSLSAADELPETAPSPVDTAEVSAAGAERANDPVASEGDTTSEGDRPGASTEPDADPPMSLSEELAALDRVLADEGVIEAEEVAVGASSSKS